MKIPFFVFFWHSLYLHVFIFAPNKYTMKSMKMHVAQKCPLIPYSIHEYNYFLPAGPFTTALLSVVNYRIVSMIGGVIAGSGLVLATLATKTSHLTFCMCLLGRWQARKSMNAKTGIKGRFRDLTVTGAPNFHQIWDFTFYILHFVLYASLNLKLILKPCLCWTTNRHWLPMFEKN